MRNIVLLNGPPGCGKDTAVSHLVPYLKFTHLKFAAPIKRMVCGLLNITVQELEETKDIPNKTLQRYFPELITTRKIDTIRDLLIALSEDFFKPRYGEDFFGRVLWQEAKRVVDDLVLVSDSGFQAEAIPVIRGAGQGQCRIIRLHRPLHTFESDSRSHLPDGMCITTDIHNDGTRHDLTMRVLRVIIREFNPPLLREPDWIK